MSDTFSEAEHVARVERIRMEIMRSRYGEVTIKEEEDILDLLRPGWDEYFSEIAKAVSARADCRRRKVGAVIVDREHRIVATGYNGSSPGGPSCLMGECPRGLLSYTELQAHQDYTSGPGLCHANHAETNAILYARREDLEGATLYCTDAPCPLCTKLLRATRITRFVYPGGNQ